MPAFSFLIRCKHQGGKIRAASRAAIVILLFALCSLCAPRIMAQTASTGALNGRVTDPSGGVIPGATVTVTNQATGAKRSTTSGADGSYLIPLLPPGNYRMEASHSGFKLAVYQNILVNVTETATLGIHLQIGEVSEKVTVTGTETLLQTTSSALGRVVGESTIQSLPLVSRNYTQILGLSPGAAGDVTNASDIGRGSTSLSAGSGGYSIGGDNTNDNNFQMNGSEVNDLEAESTITGGVPVPNPDSIQEFKVQTGQYDASYGRNAGANVDVVTKSGTNNLHGSAWEYFRNSVLNANDFFLNATGQARGVLDQNQFGGTIGGPAIQNKLFYFGSYQGTRERDGLGGGCLTSGNLPVGLTNDASSRTAVGLGAEFANAPSAIVPGETVASDGSNISPIALAVLNAQVSGGFLVPAPQTNAPVNNTTFSSPCTYNENQYIGDADWLITPNNHLSGKLFVANSANPSAFPSNDLAPATTVPGFPLATKNGFRVFSLTDTHVVNDHLLNQFVLGFHRLAGGLVQSYANLSGFANSAGCGGAGPVRLSGLCVPAVPSFADPFPSIVVLGSLSVGGNGQGINVDNENFYNVDDSVTYTRGKHSFQFGGGINRSQINFEGFHFFGGLLYPSFPDFLLGNVFISLDLPGLFDRAWRVWDGDAFVQDNYKVSSRLTLNLGFRWDREGALGDDSGRASTFNPALANPNPPAGGTIQGYVVGSNFSGGAIPPGVIQASTNTAINNDGQNGFAPRIGFAWQLPRTNRMVLRGGYGIYYGRTTGEPLIQLLAAPPWGTLQEVIAPPASAPLPSAPAFPIFQPYSPTTALSPLLMSPTFRPPIIQQYSTSLQTQLGGSWMFEVGYQGTRGTKLLKSVSFDQALFASPANPIRGETTNTLANIALRVPIEGFSPSNAKLIESSGASWYNALNVSVTKRFSHGLQLLAAYTWASDLETNPGFATNAFGGGPVIGDQNNPTASYGPDGFIRPQRLIVSYIYNIPGPVDHTSLRGRLLDGWSVAGVTTIQDGHPLTLTDANNTNAFGIVNNPFAGDGDRVQIASGCTYRDLATRGSVNSRVNNYFNSACIGVPAVIGSDGLATAFGNSGTGIIRGPDENNFDIAIIKRTPWGRTEARNVEFRAEFFNAFNTPNFGDPDTSAGTIAPQSGVPTLALNPDFGVIGGTSVNPRIIQLALKFEF